MSTLVWMEQGGALALTKDVPAMRRLTRNKDASEHFAPHLFRVIHRSEKHKRVDDVIDFP